MNDTPTVLRAARFVLICSLLVVMLLPLIWLTVGSFKSTSELTSHPYGLPRSFRPSGVMKLWDGGAFPRYFRNSVFITAISVAGVLATSILAGYALARSRLRIVKAVGGVFILGMYIPEVALLIPIFRTMSNLGLLNTPWAVILVQWAWSPLAIFLIRASFLAIPESVVEAARLDGCTEWGLLRRLFIPLSMPTILTVAVIYTLWSWNDFLWPLVLLQNPSQYTVQVGILNFVGEYTTDYGQQLAALAVTVWPPLIAYLLLRRRIQQSLMGGAIKG